MRDIKPTGDGEERSIRNVPLHNRRTRHTVTADHQEHEPSPEGPAELPHRRPRRKPRRFWLWALGVVVTCALLGLLLSTVFAGATVSVYPRTETVAVPATLQAQLNAPQGVLPYKLISVTRSASQSVPAQGTQRVSRPASGLVTISNSYSGSSQRLIANTRFEAPDGKIYRIRDSVTVPGSTGSGEALKPGTVTATIYADSPGPDYNRSSATTFTIPGFKGDPRYAKFSAQSQGAIAGGFIGEEPAVAASDLASAKTSLQKQLDGDVRSAAVSEIPEGYVAIPGTLEVAFADITQAPGEGKTATLTQNATASGAIVREGDLASAIAAKTVTGYKGEAVLFGPESSLNASLATTSKRTDETLTITLSGQAALVWQFDQNALLQALVGKNKSEFETTIQAFQPAVAKADASIRPFWRGQFPSDPNKIKIKVEGK